MKIHLIGIIEDNYSNTIGYRLVDIDSKDIKDVPENSIKAVLSNQSLCIDGIKLYNGKLVGTNGSLDRYAKIVGNRLKGKSPLVIVNQIIVNDELKGYTVIDWKGTIINATVSDVIKYAKVNGIANGSVKSINNKEFISSIQGEYRQKVIKREAEQKVVKKEEVKKVKQQKRINTFEDIIWNTDEFRDYMDSNNFSYEIKEIENKMEIQFNCSKATRLKYPNGIESVDNIFSYIDIAARELVFSPTINSIRLNILNYLPNIESITFQKGAEEITIPGLNDTKADINSTIHRINLPSTLKVIKRGLNNIQRLDSINLEETSLIRVFKCFNNVRFENGLQLPSTIQRIKDSFNCCRGIFRISIPDSIREISSSFSEISIEELDLSECKDLGYIDYTSFSKCNKLKSVKLPNGLNRLGYNVFHGCRELVEIEIPNTVESIGYGAFGDTGIKQVSLGSSITEVAYSSFSKDTVVIFDDTNTKLNSKVLANTWFKTVILSDNIETIESEALLNMGYIKSIKLPDNLNVIKEMAFKDSCSLKEVDMVGCSRLREIGDYAFMNTALIKIILPDCLEEIGRGVFKKCSMLQEVLIPQSVKKIGKEAFKNVGTERKLGTTFYVYDKSYGLAYCKRNKLRYIIIESLDEYYRKTGGSEQSEAQLAKLKLILGGSSVHKELFKEDYIGNASKLYSLYTSLKSDYDESSKPVLDTKRLINFPINKVELIDNYFKEYKPYNTEIHDTLKGYNRHNLSPIFISLMNLISNYIPLNPAPLTIAGMEYIKNTEQVKTYKIVYSDRDSAILTIQLNGMEVIIVATIGQNIVYVGVANMNLNSMLFTALSNGYKSKNGLKLSVVKSISSGTGFAINNTLQTLGTVGGIVVPPYIISELSKRFTEDVLLIGLESISDKSYGKARRAICMDLVSGKFMICSVKTQHIVNYWYSINHVDILEIKEINNLTPQDNKIIMGGVNVDEAVRKYVYIADKDGYFKSLSKNKDAYDTEPCYEWQIGQILGKLIGRPKEDIPIAVYQAIYKSDLYATIRKKDTILKSTSDEYKTIVLSSGEHIISEYIVNRTSSYNIPGLNGNFLVNIMGGEINTGNALTCYVSSRETESNINMLSKLCIGDTEAKEPRIDNIEISQTRKNSDFITLASEYYNNRSIDICIGKLDGGVYIVGQSTKDRCTYYKIVRFKSLKDAVLLFTESITPNKKRVPNVKEDILLMAHLNVQYLDSYNEASGTYEQRETALIRLRNEIMNGLPNGGYVPGVSTAFIDLLAKQSK